MSYILYHYFIASDCELRDFRKFSIVLSEMGHISRDYDHSISSPALSAGHGGFPVSHRRAMEVGDVTAVEFNLRYVFLFTNTDFI